MCGCVYLRLDLLFVFFFFQAEDGIRDLVRSRGLGDVYKRQLYSGGGGRSGLPRDSVSALCSGGGGSASV